MRLQCRTEVCLVNWRNVATCSLRNSNFAQTPTFLPKEIQRTECACKLNWRDERHFWQRRQTRRRHYTGDNAARCHSRRDAKRNGCRDGDKGAPSRPICSIDATYPTTRAPAAGAASVTIATSRFASVTSIENPMASIREQLEPRWKRIHPEIRMWNRMPHYRSDLLRSDDPDFRLSRGQIFHM